MSEKELFQEENFTSEFKEAIFKKSEHKNYQSANRMSDYIEKYAEGIFKIVWYAYHRDQYLIWDFNENKQVNIRKKALFPMQEKNLVYWGMARCRKYYS